MVENCLFLEGQRQYKEDQQRLWKAVDISIDDPKQGYLEKHSIGFYRCIEHVEDNLYKLPEVSSLPMWEVRIGIDKESKMYLTKLPTPNNMQIQSFRIDIRRFLRSIDLPNQIKYPEREELIVLSSNKCYIHDRIQEDQDPTSSGFGPCLYQAFMTGFDSPRESWLPSPEYKRSSRFWALVTNPILNKVKYSCMNKTDSDIWRLLRYQHTKATSFDLKGSGLQFQHEYVVEVAQALCEIYPELEEELSIMKNLLSNLEVIKDNTTEKVNRGLGLGYYTPLKCLAVWSMLQDKNILASFDDDMLIDSRDYESTLEIIKYYGLIVNEKKSGHIWKNVYWFIEAGISEDGLVAMSTEQADIAAIFRQRFHWERKMITASLEKDVQFSVGYHLEKIYGYEFHRYESCSSFEEGGYTTNIPSKFGMSRGKYSTLVDIKPNKRSAFEIKDLFPTEAYTLSRRKQIHQARKARWKSGKSIHTDDSELLKKVETTSFKLDYYKFPAYAERMLNLHSMTSGCQFNDTPEYLVRESLVRFPSSNEPLNWLQSKEEYEPRIQTSQNPEIISRYEHILSCDLIERRLLQSTVPNVPNRDEIRNLYNIEVPTLESLGTFQYSMPEFLRSVDPATEVVYDSNSSIHSSTDSRGEVDDLYLQMLTDQEQSEYDSSDDESL
jgi:hypothetical protein